jgi:hypothetical protein
MALATSLPVDPQGRIAEIVGTFAVGDLLTRTAAGWVPITKAALSTAVDTAFLSSVTLAPDATFAWGASQPNVEVTHAAAKCVITVPAATDVVSWAVGEARRLAVANVGGFGIGFAAVADAGFNYAAVNNAIVTLTGSNVTPAVGVNVPVYTVFRKSAALYLISVGW